MIDDKMKPEHARSPHQESSRRFRWRWENAPPPYALPARTEPGCGKLGNDWNPNPIKKVGVSSCEEDKPNSSFRQTIWTVACPPFIWFSTDFFNDGGGDSGTGI